MCATYRRSYDDRKTRLWRPFTQTGPQEARGRRVAEPEPEVTIGAQAASGAPADEGMPSPPAILAPPAIPPAGRPHDENPVLAYLARLSPGSRRTMRASLETIACLASAGEVGALDFSLVDAPLPALRGDPREARRGLRPRDGQQDALRDEGRAEELLAPRAD
jgi:hypothetical protein